MNKLKSRRSIYKDDRKDKIDLYVYCVLSLILVSSVFVVPDIFGRKFFTKEYWIEVVNSIGSDGNPLESRIDNAKFDSNEEVIISPLGMALASDFKNSDLKERIQPIIRESNEKALDLLVQSLKENKGMFLPAKGGLEITNE